MDAEFEHRWRAAQSPFDGLTVTARDYLPLPLLKQALGIVVACLASHRPDAELFRLRDWHEHDGFVSNASSSSWQDLRALIASEAALAACMGDTYVREGLFPAERDYYLRLYVPEPWDNPCPYPCGMFDVTCPRSLAEEIIAAIKTAGICHVEARPAVAFFNESYRG